MQIDLEAFFFLLLAVVVFIVYAIRKGKNKRPTIAEEVSWEELTIEQALQQYIPAAASAPLPISENTNANSEPLPQPVEAAAPTPDPEPEYFTYEDDNQVRKPKKVAKKHKQTKRHFSNDLKKPFVFNPRDAILYDAIWNKKY